MSYWHVHTHKMEDKQVNSLQKQIAYQQFTWSRKVRED